MYQVRGKWALITGGARGIAVGVFVNDGKSGRYLGAQHFAGMTLADAVRKAETEFDSPYGR